MYKIIPEDERRVYSDADLDSFGEKWVFIIHAKFTPESAFIEGVPIVIADEPFEGNEIVDYDKYMYDHDGKYDEIFGCDLRPYRNSVPISDSSEGDVL